MSKLPCMYNFDFFGHKPKLYFQGKSKSGTKIGLFLTFLFVFFSLACFIYFGKDLYYHENPSVIYNEEYQSLPEKYILDQELSPLLIDIHSPYADEYYTDPTMIKAKVAQFTIDRNDPDNSFSIKEFDLEKCNKDHFNKTSLETQNYFFKFNLSNYLCIPKNLKNLTIQGAFDQNIFQAIKIFFKICDNKTDSNCKELDYIKEKVNRGFVAIYMNDQTLNPGDYDRVKKDSPRQIFTNFVLNSQKEIDVFYKNNYIKTDDGFLMENEQEEKIVNYDSTVEFNFMQENQEFVMFYLRLAQKKIMYKRKYAKVQNLIAQVGGFINCFWLIAMGLNYLHAHLVFIRDIVLNIFSIKFIQVKSRMSKIHTKTDFFKLKTTAKNNILESSTSKNVDIIDTSNEPPSQEILTLKLGFLDFINYYLGIFKSPERDQRKAIIQKGMKIMKKNLDVSYLIQKFYEIEKLKILLLNDEQFKNFDKLPKPELELVINKNRFEVLTKFMTRRISNETEKDSKKLFVKQTTSSTIHPKKIKL